MSKFTSFFKGSRPSKSRETVAELRKQSSDIKIRARALKRLADEERSMAKDFLKDGNKGAAEKALMRRKRYQSDLGSLMSKAAMINRVIEAIAKAEQNDKLLRVLQASKTMLDKTASSTRLEQAEEIMTGLEMSIENVNYIEERFGESALLDDDLDYEMADVSDEMNVLMSEIQEETAPSKRKEGPEKRPTQRRKVLDTSGDLPEAEKGASEDIKEQELQAEIDRIKREMEEELN
jgi:hypothetical protein